MASSSTLVNLKVEGIRQPVTVMVRDVQREPRTGAVLHVDFYAVRMSERIRTEVPVHLVGTAPVVSDGIGMLTQTLRTVEVDALPNELPGALEADISGLTAVHDSVFVRDLKVPPGVTVHADGDSVVASVSQVRSAAEEEEAAPAAEPERVAPEREEEEEK
jgi:large subunit ribosomal protein L25